MKRIIVKQIFKKTYLLLLVILIFSCKENKSNKDQGLLERPLKIGIVSWPGYAGGIYANDGFKPNKESIYWKKYNLLVEFVLLEDVDVRAKSFVRGGKSDVDIVWTTIDFWANELPGIFKGGVPAKAFMQVDWSKGGDAIVVDESINSVEELVNKKVALAALTPSHWFYEYVMRDSDITPEQLKNLGKSIVSKSASTDARLDFIANNVDACVVWEPDIANALKERKGSKILVSSSQYNNILADLMVARVDFINKHPEVIQAFVDGWFDGVEKAKMDKSKTADLLMNNEPLFKEIGKEQTLSIIEGVDLTNIEDNIKMFGLDGGESVFNKLFREAGDVWLSRGFINDTINPNKAFTDEFLIKYLKK